MGEHASVGVYAFGVALWVAGMAWNIVSGTLPPLWLVVAGVVVMVIGVLGGDWDE